ncbi:hypothetical protein GGR92_005283 [Spirosoma lacussanchae]|uniref:hypothetical protein n=1 Tax=Spirosoma lacussanchae TaxID=1884249 RepID=UPI001109C1CE|nr:hypothetical protein [Spirosoma lacussanchae]
MPISANYNLANYVNGSDVPDYRISSASVYFRLIYGADELVIQEPVGWDAAEWVLQRDPVWHGFTFEFTGDEALLRFRQVEAIDFIEQAYLANGVAATVLLRWGLADSGVDLPMQTLKLKMGTKNVVGGELSIAAEVLSMHPDIQPYWDSKISMTARESIKTEGGLPQPITPPLPANLMLHAQSIKQTTTTKPPVQPVDTDWLPFVNTGGSILQGGNPLTGLAGTNVYRTFYLSLPFSEPVPDEVKDFSGSMTGISVDKPAPILIAKEEGALRVQVTVDFQVDCRLQKAGISLNPPDVGSWSVKCVLVAGNVTYPIGTVRSGRTNSRFMGAQRISATLDLPGVPVSAGTPISIYGLLEISPNRSNWRGTDVRLTANNATLTLTAVTTAPTSTAPAYPIKDVLRQLVAGITGRANAVQSAYYSLAGGNQPVDGGGSHRMLTNGFGLRGFTQRPLTLSLQDCLTSLQAIDAIGIGYRPTDTGDVLVVEPIAYFYRNVELLRIESYTVIDRKIDTNRLHPRINIGYRKFPDEGPQVLDEFNVRQEYATPVREGVAYEQESDFVASGYAIEMTRRNQFTKTPQDSTTYDDDTFIIAVDQSGPLTSAVSATLTVQFVFSRGKASLLIDLAAAPTWLAKGVTIQIAGAGLNEKNVGLFRIEAAERSSIVTIPSTGVIRLPVVKPAMLYTLNREVFPETKTATLSIGQTGIFRAERAEDYADVRGILDPDTTYNLRLAPRFNLMRHARYLAGSFIHVNGSEKLTFSFAKNNQGLRTRLADNAPGDQDIDSRQTVVHTDDLYVAALTAVLPPLWEAETISIETQLALEQMLYLKAALRMAHPDPELHLGYITLAGRDGEPDTAFFPTEIRHTPASGKTILTGIKKYVSSLPVNSQRGCEFYAAYVFDAFESAPGSTIDTWIEGCRFGDFL